MNQKARCRLTENSKKNQSAGFSLFEFIISLTLILIMMMMLISVGIETTKIWRGLAEEEALMNEGRTLLHMLSRDLKSAALCSENFHINLPLASSQQNIFFLRRTLSNDLVAVGYFLDPNKKNLCYRFCANPNETLAARNKGTLTNLYTHAVLEEAHCEPVAKHLLSWEMIPVWKNEKEMILLEINLAFGKTTPRYFLSTVIALPPSQ